MGNDMVDIHRFLHGPLFCREEKYQDSHWSDIYMERRRSLQPSPSPSFELLVLGLGMLDNVLAWVGNVDKPNGLHYIA